VHLGKVAVDRLIRLLREGQPAVRAVIATILGEVADERATAPLIAALQDEEDVRSSASTALAKIDDAAVPLLLDTLGRVPPEFQREVVRTLGEIGDLRSVEPLINALESKSEEVRVQAAIALGKVGVPAAVGPLVLHLQDPETVGVRHRATWALGAIGQPAAIEPLVSCLDDPDIRVRGTAVESLVSLKYIGPDLERRRPTVEELMAAWRSEDEDLVEYAVDALNKAGELAVWPLILALTEPNSRIRSMAVVQLGSMQDKRAVQPLIDRLRTDTDATVRCLTAVMLSEWKDERVNQSLVEALSDKEEDVSSAAYLSLVKIGESAVEPLIAALYQSNKSIQLYAVSALGGIGDERAIRPVGELLIKRGDLRQEAALALEGIGAPAVDFLIASLSDEDPEVRGLAMSSLLNIGGPAIDPLIATWREPKYIELAPYSMDVLIRFGQIAISPLTTALQNKSDAVSMRAARVLVEIGEPAIPLLISILRDKFSRARLKVAATLAEISGELAQKAVEAFLETSGAGDRAQVKKIQRKLKKLSKGSRFE
jgi:HEAT repeat protein